MQKLQYSNKIWQCNPERQQQFLFALQRPFVMSIGVQGNYCNIRIRSLRKVRASPPNGFAFAKTINFQSPLVLLQLVSCLRQSGCPAGPLARIAAGGGALSPPNPQQTWRNMEHSRYYCCACAYIRFVELKGREGSSVEVS